MSTSSVCQGLQSCLEAQVLRLKLAPPNPNPDAHRGLSFLQALAEPPEPPAAVYVHPMVKRSASFLSAKSLDMCTESLGSETGGGNDDDDNDSSSSAAEARPKPPRAPKRRSGRAFPPPLASAGGLKFRPHREAGRLVLRAVMAPSPAGSIFRAERADGRLRLRLVSFKPLRAVGDDGEEEEEDEVVEEDEEEEYSDYEEEEEGLTESGVKVVKGKLRRYGRCKDGNNNSNNNGNNKVLWDQPYLVAT